MKIRKITRRRRYFVDDAKQSDFTLLFCRGRQRNHFTKMYNARAQLIVWWRSRCRRRRALLKLPNMAALMSCEDTQCFNPKRVGKKRIVKAELVSVSPICTVESTQCIKVKSPCFCILSRRCRQLCEAVECALYLQSR